jgi:5-methylthioribose kinase
VTQGTADIEAFLRERCLAAPGEVPRWELLTGGVSCEVWKVNLPGRALCVKRALPRLRVASEWLAPVSRNTYEWRWLAFAREHVPEAVPELFAHDEGRALFAMSYLPAASHPVWKAELLAGVVDPEFAGKVGEILARLHNASAGRSGVAATFDSLANFHALRLEPYLLATAAAHPDLGDRLRTLASRTAAGKIALVHGDVSPKNILVGPAGPVFLDAECAWYGDPAFDVAFCLNHLLLKALARPDRAGELAESFAQFTRSYLARAAFEVVRELERRAAELLPGLMLARIDGKSPVEYLAGKAREQDLVRGFARGLLQRPAARLQSVQDAWTASTARAPGR